MAIKDIEVDSYRQHITTKLSKMQRTHVVANYIIFCVMIAYEKTKPACFQLTLMKSISQQLT